MRIGSGYDIHRLVEKRPLILGGVKIPYHKGLMGHSDADVLVHAVIDALLGAVNDGDIGCHFPSNDPTYEGVSSLVLLRRIGMRVDEYGFTIANIDTTVVAEEPKLGPFKAEMAKTIARALDLSENLVSIKAHTNEGLGAIGRGEAIAAYAVALVEERR